ncbi:hypothetical protein [Deminuibacter soli]|nr:hypothetical protein [Deminuibacter soli]
MNTGFFNSPLLSTIICLVLIFALLSLLVSTLTEAVNGYFQERGQLLYKTIGNMFYDGINVNFGQLLYHHPMVKNLKKDKYSLPQYISAALFSNTLIDVICNTARSYGTSAATPPAGQAVTPVPDSVFNKFKKGVELMHHTDLKMLLVNMVERCENIAKDDPLPLLKTEIQQWYNDQMERTSGWYKTWMRHRIFYIALLVALVLNVDSIHLFQTLYRSPDLRNKLEPIAESMAQRYSEAKTDTSLAALDRAYKAIQAPGQNTDSSFQRMLDKYNNVLHNQRSVIDTLFSHIDTTKHLQQVLVQIDSLSTIGLPLGWRGSMAPLSWFNYKTPADKTYFEEHKVWSFTNFFLYVAGIFITSFSLTAGAPFWFDLLLRVVNIRRSGAKPSN